MNSLPISYRYIPKSLSSRDCISRVNSSPNKKINIFIKTTNIKQLNTNGTSPIIIYKKTPRAHYKPEINFGLLKSGEYVTDGGLKKKLEKFNTENTNKENKSKILSSSNSKSIIKTNCSQSMKSIRKKKENNNKKKIMRNNYFSSPPKSTSSNNKSLKKSIKKTKENSKKEKKEKKNEKKEENEFFEEEKKNIRIN